ncbi:MAG: glycosyltransferase 61 family protein [Roseiarcus sp.]
MVKAFYQSIHYEALRERKFRRGPLGGAISFSDRHPAARDSILDYFNETSIERVGVLHGEYLLLHSGVLLVDRKGVMTGACISLEDRWVAQFMATESARPETTAHIRELLDNWDRAPAAHNLPVLCDPYSNNYYHFSLEMIPRVRYFAPGGHTSLIMSKNSLARPFQRDLVVHTLGAMTCLPLDIAMRVYDPILAHDTMSNEGIFWLRHASGIAARPGNRRIYVRRAARGTRSDVGGGISESAGFQALLRDFGFETVDFGNGENGVAAQIAMLDGVGLILSAHGAALTNLAYLNPKLTVIEVIGPRTPRACFMHIAAALGFEYHGIFSNAYDDRLDIVVDLDELHEALRARM